MNETHLIIGPNLPIDIEKTIAIYKKGGRPLKVYGNGISLNTIIKLPLANTVIIYAHGSIYNNKHKILISSKPTKTEFVLNNINKKVNLEILACYSGKSIDEISHLPMGSTLKTLAAPKHLAWSALCDQIIFQAASFLYPDNPFAKYIFNLLTNPEENNFAIHITNGDYPSFTSSIKSREDFSISAIKEWHRTEIHRFLQFLKKIRNRTNETHKKQIAQILELLNTDIKIEKWISDSQTRLYQELLLTIPILNKNFKLARLILKSGVDINTIINNYTYLSIAVCAEREAMVKFLINNGANKEIILAGEFNALWFAVIKNSLSITKFLLKKGADINAEINEVTIIQIIANKGCVSRFKFLLRYGASLKGCNKENIPKITKYQAIMDEIARFNADPVGYITEPDYSDNRQSIALNNLSKQAHLLRFSHKLEEEKVRIKFAYYLEEQVEEATNQTDNDKVINCINDWEYINSELPTLCEIAPGISTMWRRQAEETENQLEDKSMYCTNDWKYISRYVLTEPWTEQVEKQIQEEDISMTWREQAKEVAQWHEDISTQAELWREQAEEVVQNYEDISMMWQEQANNLDTSRDLKIKLNPTIAEPYTLDEPYTFSYTAKELFSMAFIGLAFLYLSQE